MHAIAPFFFFLLVIGAFAAVAFHARRSSIRLDGRSLDVLLDGLGSIDLQGMDEVARDYLEPRRGQIAMEPEVLWNLLGGEAGLRAMRVNADLLLALAAHATQWNEEEGSIVAERMRRDAIRLRSAVRQVRIGMLSQMVTGQHWVSVPFQLQEAAAAYYLMRRRLLALYETSHVALLPRVAAAI